MNKVILVGRVGADPQAKRTKDGKSVCTFSLATPRANAKSVAEKTCDWHLVSVFGSQADICQQSLKTGARVLVDGAITTSSYTSKQGEKKTSIQILAYGVTFLDSKVEGAKSSSSSNGSSKTSSRPVVPSSHEDDNADYAFD